MELLWQSRGSLVRTRLPASISRAAECRQSTGFTQWALGAPSQPKASSSAPALTPPWDPVIIKLCSEDKK